MAFSKDSAAFTIVRDVLPQPLELVDWSEETQASLVGFLRSTLATMPFHPEVAELLETFAAERPRRFRETLGVGLCSLLLCEGLGWKAVQTRHKVVLAALLRDIGEREVPLDILEKADADRTPEERAIYESHTQKGYDMLSALPALPNEIAQVALQHHENYAGTGFPSKRRHGTIIPLAHFVGISEAFWVRYNELRRQGERAIRGSQILADLRRLNPECFEEVVLKTLTRYFERFQQERSL